MQTRYTGFTLVEVLVVAPIIILFIGGFIALLVTLTGESLVLREKNSAAYDTQAALDDMEATIKQAVDIRLTTGVVPVPQGKDNSTSTGTPFTNTTSGQPDTLILYIAATSAGPNNSARELIYTGSAPCSPQNSLYSYFIVYFVALDPDTPSTTDSALYKRTILPALTTCAPPVQRGSCTSSRMSGYASVCKSLDEKVASGITTFDLTYFTGSQAITDAQADTATDVLINMTLQRSTAGKTATYSGSLRAGSLNI